MRLTPDTHLHSREHVLADDLSRMMLEPKRFAAYLGIAEMYHESDLRALAKRVVQKPDLDSKNRGKYFFGALRGLAKRPERLGELKAKRRQLITRSSMRYAQATNRRRTS